MFQRLSTPALAATLVISSLSGLAGCGGSGVSSTSAPTQDPVEKVAARAGRPVYYLGQQFRDWAVSEASIDNDTGRIHVIYGTCAPGPDSSCAPPLEVLNEKLDPVAWGMAEGCSRLPPLRGVPAVNFGDALVLLTADSLITVGVGDGDAATAMEAVDQLRRVGADLSRDALPPPDPAALQILEAACGKNPGDSGRPRSDQEPQPALDRHVPDFSVDQLGGGQLRWAAYRGKPVVVVVGDVPHVIRGIQRVRALRPSPRPVVIGLVWKPFGSKDAPAPIAEIEREAGRVPVPVGYAAIPQPAVWFFDMAEVDPAQSGVIGFVNDDGVLVGHLRTDASNDAIVAGLDELTRP